MTKTVSQIRTAFLEYFAENGHTKVPSAPLVPHNDPTLMFTNAGMVPFKNVFTGVEKRDYTRATSSQKCVRAGGKHNDLDNVGYTVRHHTFFEMLGNFSFGDYFKEDAIKFGWEFLTNVMEIPKEKLSVTVYHTDDEAFELWQKIAGLPKEKILRVPTKDNFWAMGDTGPCGPCSEIFYDHGADAAEGKWALDKDGNDLFGDRFIEIWNLVFMQYEQVDLETRIDLPNPCIDTGMGLERIAAVMQGVHDNYDTDLFQTLINASQELSGNKDKSHLVSHRVIADHLRSSCFLLADGVMPSNEGRGYVLRRIMRRAMRHVRQLGYKKPLMHQLVPTLISEMGEAYPELARAKALITEILKLEEERFGETLDRGLKLLEDESKSLKKGDALSGDVAFKLYDTYGFPLDLTKDILRAREVEVDEKGFDAAMAEQKKRARAAWKGSGEAATEEVWFDIKEAHGATEFLGYEAHDAQGKIVALVHDGKSVKEATKGADVLVVLNQTPFYGESGGQQGDHGTLKTESGAVLKVVDTEKKLGELHIHVAKVAEGTVKADDVVEAHVDVARRSAIRANHSATHIVHAVLREVLGDHVTQKGSLVAPDRFRFDFSHPKGLSAEEMATIEAKVNHIVRQNSDVGTRLMTPDEAIAAGAMALFGEKYGDEVRVVNMGVDGGKDYSVELCGGTHVRRTGDIGLFKIVSESAIAAGVRRIEAMTGEAAFTYLAERDAALSELAASLKTTPEQVVERVQSLQDERKKLEKELAEAKKAAAMGGGEAIKAEEINGIPFIGKHFEGVAAKDLRGIVGDLQKSVPSGVVAVTSSEGGKASLIIAVSDDLTGKVNAVTLVQAAAETLGAKGGGGKPNFAQTGGSDASGAAKALEIVKEKLSA